MRRAGTFLMVVALAACSHGHNNGINAGGPAGSWRTAQQIAAALCERAKPEPAQLAASFPTTIADFRKTTIGTIGPTQTHRFPNLAATDDGAWCWIGRPGYYDVYEVAVGGDKALVVSGSLHITRDGHPDAN